MKEPTLEQGTPRMRWHSLQNTKLLLYTILWRRDHNSPINEALWGRRSACLLLLHDAIFLSYLRNVRRWGYQVCQRQRPRVGPRTSPPPCFVSSGKKMKDEFFCLLPKPPESLFGSARHRSERLRCFFCCKWEGVNIGNGFVEEAFVSAVKEARDPVRHEKGWFACGICFGQTSHDDKSENRWATNQFVHLLFVWLWVPKAILETQ